MLKKPEAVAPYLNQLEHVILIPETDPLYSIFLLYKAHYEILMGVTTAAKRDLDAAENYILKNNSKGNTTIATLHYVFGLYHQAVNENYLALREIDRIYPINIAILDNGRLSAMTFTKANILAQLNRPQEACELLRDMITTRETMNSQNYTMQINSLRALYQVNDMEVERQQYENQLMRWIILSVLIVVLIVAILILYFRRSSHRLEISKQTEEKAKADAEASAQSKSMFLSNMSHEIRTPLNALIGFSAILTQEGIDKDTRKQCVDIIQQNSELLLKLIDDIVNLTNMDFGHMEFKYEEHDVVSICRNVVDMVEKIKQTQAEIIFKTAFPELEIQTDTARLQQVLINLIINATKYTPSGSITLELRPDRQVGFLLFMVTDTGSGISLENQKKIFNRFETLDELKPGTGLGLSICQLIINQLGGKIWIDSEYTGGSRFCFTHPISHKTNS
jgi:signal transduction histidine kinase